MGRWGETLAFGLGGAAVYAGGFALAWGSLQVLGGGWMIGAAWVFVPGLAALGYLAGQRHSLPGLLAVIVGYGVPWLVVWITRWSP
jgi:hypothetical protein